MIGAPIPAPSSLNPEVPAGLDRLVGWMLLTSPGDRPSAATISLHLSSYWEGEDLDALEHLNYAAGLPPFLRGPYSAMYSMRPGPSGSMLGFPLPKSPMHFTEGTWQPDKKVCL